MDVKNLEKQGLSVHHMKCNKVLKASLWYTISNFLLKGIGIITTPIFSRLLTQDEYGILNNFNAWLAIITIVGSLSLSSSLVRARFDYKYDLNSFIKSNLFCGTLATVCLFFIFALNLSYWEELFVLDKKYFVIMCLTIMVSPAYDMFIQVEQFRYKYKMVTALSTFVALSTIGLSFVLIWLFEDNLFARIIGGQLPVIMIGICLYAYFIIKGKGFKFVYLKYSIPMCLPYMVHLLSGTLLNSSDRTMITNMCGPSENALYSMAYNIALIVSVLWNSMNTVFSPWLGEKLNHCEYIKIRKYSSLYLMVFLFVVFGIMLVAPEVLFILGGEKYIKAEHVIPPVMVGYTYLFMYSLYVNIEQFEKKTMGMALCTIMCALINIGLNWIFIPMYGYIAAAYTTLVGYAVMLISHYFIVKKMGMACCYDNRFILFSSILAFVMGLLCNLLYVNMFARFLALFVYIISMMMAIFKYRDIIKEVLHSK